MFVILMTGLMNIELICFFIEVEGIEIRSTRQSCSTADFSFSFLIVESPHEDEGLFS